MVEVGSAKTTAFSSVEAEKSFSPAALGFLSGLALTLAGSVSCVDYPFSS